jgi:hypothetical protein
MTYEPYLGHLGSKRLQGSDDLFVAIGFWKKPTTLWNFILPQVEVTGGKDQLDWGPTISNRSPR